MVFFACLFGFTVWCTLFQFNTSLNISSVQPSVTQTAREYLQRLQLYPTRLFQLVVLDNAAPVSEPGYGIQFSDQKGKYIGDSMSGKGKVFLSSTPVRRWGTKVQICNC
jgi:hypothetical protein